MDAPHLPLAPAAPVQRSAPLEAERATELAAELAPRIEKIYQELEALIGKSFARDLYQTLDVLLEKIGRVPPDSE